LRALLDQRRRSVRHGRRIAEVWWGPHGRQDAVFFAVDDHTTADRPRGAAMIGTRGRAASVAWLALNPVEREDYRKIGCLEAEVAAAGIVRRLICESSRAIARGQRRSRRRFLRHRVQQVLDGAGKATRLDFRHPTREVSRMPAANLVVVADGDARARGIMATAPTCCSIRCVLKSRAGCKADDGPLTIRTAFSRGRRGYRAARLVS